ncbi:hypothetical protein G7Y89_g12251 [Cudoniella acicularis]|uniref:MARVEL domain-containing protein n=1 Tax=Cudoniella acicularis TaxID=354080 RepID=A0A8H4RAF4_9HELO|nr:hypothetical protein G7Y89_g12251 [Cudoniella acicularis]
MLYEETYEARENRRRSSQSSSQLSITFITIAFIDLVLTGYIITVFDGDTFHSFALTFISFTWTFFFMLYIFITPSWLPAFYHYWTHLGLEITAFALWISDFSLLCWETMLGDGTLGVYSTGLDPTLAASAARPIVKVAVDCGKAADVLSCLNWILFGTTLILFVRRERALRQQQHGQRVEHEYWVGY